MRHLFGFYGLFLVISSPVAFGAESKPPNPTLFSSWWMTCHLKDDLEKAEQMYKQMMEHLKAVGGYFPTFSLELVVADQ